jgi:type I restriction enzyme, S subunit
MSELPSGWVKTNLRSIAEIDMGQSPKGEFTNTDSIGLPLLGGAADYDGDELRASRFTSSPTKVCSLGDIVLGASNNCLPFRAV